MPYGVRPCRIGAGWLKFFGITINHSFVRNMATLQWGSCTGVLSKPRSVGMIDTSEWSPHTGSAATDTTTVAKMSKSVTQQFQISRSRASTSKSRLPSMVHMVKFK